MNMVVCVKQVIDPEAPPATFKIDSSTSTVVPPQGIAPVIDPYGEFALEAALKVKDANGGKITAISPSSQRIRHYISNSLASC